MKHRQDTFHTTWTKRLNQDRKTIPFFFVALSPSIMVGVNYVCVIVHECANFNFSCSWWSGAVQSDSFQIFLRPESSPIRKITFMLHTESDERKIQISVRCCYCGWYHTTCIKMVNSVPLWNYSVMYYRDFFQYSVGFVQFASPFLCVRCCLLLVVFEPFSY